MSSISLPTFRIGSFSPDEIGGIWDKRGGGVGLGVGFEMGGEMGLGKNKTLFGF